MRSKAQAVLLCQIAGDSLGSLVECESPESILQMYPLGVRELVSGGKFNTLAGQPTDDSEMALLLARSLVAKGIFDVEDVKSRYRYWFSTDPFDCGSTIFGAMKGRLNLKSQANGALMRISPLGIFGVNYNLEQVANWAIDDAALTHPNPICLQINALYTMAITTAIRENPSPKELYQQFLFWAKKRNVDVIIIKAIERAVFEPPLDFIMQMGWVLIAFQNAIYQLLHANTLEDGIVNTILRGGDTDTNAAIAGALLGAVYGIEAVPEQWKNAILQCKPMAYLPGVDRPRPSCFWPIDVMELAENLIEKR